MQKIFKCTLFNSSLSICVSNINIFANATHVIVAGIFGTLCWKNAMHASSYLLGINVTTFNKQQLATSGR
jgi:hypothetical protein